MTVTDQAEYRHEHAGQFYYFCSAKCQDKFAADPLHYLVTAQAAETSPTKLAAIDGTIYTCPMHPDVRQDHPGNYPKCGMTLEPELSKLDDDDNPELRDFQRRFWWTLPLTAVVFVLAMFGHRLQWMDVLRLATPMSIMVATGLGATRGALFRDAAAIENLRKVDTLIIDKTGTLTEGRPAFDRAVPAPGFDADEVLRLAASLDQVSEHPLAETIVRAARERAMTLDKPEKFESESGIGVRGQLAGRQLAVGNTTLMQQMNVSVALLLARAEELRNEVGGRPVGWPAGRVRSSQTEHTRSLAAIECGRFAHPDGNR